MASDALLAVRFAVVAHGSAHYAQMLDLRQRVLRAPLGLDVYAEDLNAERAQLHYALLDAADQVAACVLAAPLSATSARIRQMAVEPRWQRRGLGTLLMRAAEADLRQRRCTHLTLHARIEVVNFYAQLGYHRVGQPFVELSIVHQQMDKHLALPEIAGI